MERSRNGDVCVELRQISNIISREILTGNVHDDELISDMSGWILLYLADNEAKDVFQKDIEELFSLRRSTVSKKISLMEQKGLVYRASVSYDARLKRIVITDKAKKMLKSLTANAEAVENRLTEGLSDEELDALYSLIHKLKNNLESSGN